MQAKDITGLKYFDQLAPLLQRLHDDGCERDAAGNRKLHHDQYCMLVLLYLFNPMIVLLNEQQRISKRALVRWNFGCADVRWHRLTALLVMQANVGTLLAQCELLIHLDRQIDSRVAESPGAEVRR